jgi:hypothetical protein
MKTISLIGVLSFTLLWQASAQNEYSQDVSSIDNLIATLYSVISGEKGELRDWDRFKNLFVADARLIPSGKNKESKIGYRIMTSSDYVGSAGKRLEEVGFHEQEINRKTEEYGSLVHVWSTYESYHSKSDKAPFARGINSIQLMNDGNRWWILQIYWLGESAENPLPNIYLPKTNE